MFPKAKANTDSDTLIIQQVSFTRSEDWGTLLHENDITSL